VGAVGGLQAQVASAAELMLWARSDRLVPGALDRLLWVERALAKTWTMRGTLHVVPPDDIALLGAARGGYEPFPDSWLRYFEISRADFDLLMDTVSAALSDQPLSRRQLAEAVAHRAHPELGRQLLGGWGTFLKPLARRGLLINGPPRGQEATFVSADTWFGPRRLWTPAEAGPEVVRRYLGTYGPANRADYARWLGARPPWGRQAWVAAAAGLEEVEVDGRRLWMLAVDVPHLEAAEPDPRVRLLGPFDTWVLGHADRSHLFTEAQRPLVSRTAGWISALVLRGGRVAGTWTYKKDARGLEVTVALFAPLPAPGRKQLKAEAERLVEFLGGPLTLKID